MEDLEKQIEESMQQVAEYDGYSNFYDITEELQSEYIRRAYYKVIQSMYSEKEVFKLIGEAFLIGTKDLGTEALCKWFQQHKK